MVRWQSPKDIAPDCYRLAWRKNQSVSVALGQGKWMRGLRRMNTEATLRQFVDLWRKLQTIQLTDNQDTNMWKFSATKQYSSKSACEVQFTGCVAETKWEWIWKAKVEHKCKFFMWLLLQQRLPTSDRIIFKGGQANPLCMMCRAAQEKTLHTIAKCSYAREVLRLLAQWGNFQLPQLTNVHRLLKWWELMS